MPPLGKIKEELNMNDLAIFPFPKLQQELNKITLLALKKERNEGITLKRED